MSACPQCGVVIQSENATGRRVLVHEPGTQKCRVRAWERACLEQDLVRVEGAESVELAEFVDVVYGPVFWRNDRSGQVQFASGVFVPRWAHYLFEATGGARSLGWGNRLPKAFRRAQVDASFRAALLSVGDLSDAFAARRAAIAAFLTAELP